MNSTLVVDEIGLFDRLKNLVTGSKHYLCECVCGDRIFAVMLADKSPALAATRFVDKIDVLANAYPFLNGRAGAVSVTDINTGDRVEFGMEGEKKYVYRTKLI